MEVMRKARSRVPLTAIAGVMGVLAVAGATQASGASHARPAASLPPPSAAIPAPDGAGGRFGQSIAVSSDGTEALVGAPFDGRAGRIWFYRRSGAVWTADGPAFAGTESPGMCEGEELTEPEACRFGFSVALSGDGATALVGVPGSDGDKGAVWVFTRSSSSWSRGPELHGTGAAGAAHFGRAVALSGDGDTALISGPWDGHGEGAVWVFTRSGGTWAQQGGKLTSGEASGEEQFGRSVALSGDGTTALIGAPNYAGKTGAVFAFGRSGETWSRQTPRLESAEASGEEQFGKSVALSEDGTTALIGAPNRAANTGASFAFTRAGSKWSPQGSALAASDGIEASRFGTSVALSGGGNVALVGGSSDAQGSGAAWELGRSGERFSVLGKATLGGGAEAARFGTSVALSSSGAVALVGGPFDASEAGGVWSLPEAFAEGPPSEPPPPPPPPGEEESPPAGPGPLRTGTIAPAGGVLSTTIESSPAPEVDRSGDVEPTSGKVLVKLPGSSAYVPLTGLRNVPFGTIIDATKGKVLVVTIGPRGKLQRITFFAGIFELLSRGHGRVLAKLVGGNFSICPTARERAHRASTATVVASRKHVVRKLWASGHGSYSTKGGYAAGAVQGTRWLTEDKCDGTLIVVATDRVSVTNLVTGRHRTVRAHHRYFAAAP